MKTEINNNDINTETANNSTFITNTDLNKFSEKYYTNKIFGDINKGKISEYVSSIKNRSVTPDTHISRTFVKDGDELKNFTSPNITSIKSTNRKNLETKNESVILEKAEESSSENKTTVDKLDIKDNNFEEKSDPFYYVDEYQYKDSKTSCVLHFGINICREKLKEEKNKSLELKKENNSDKLSNISGATLIAKFAQQNGVKLEQLEQDLLQSAVQYLTNNKDVKTILVDIFERTFKGTQGKISDIDLNLKETHTIVLYKDNNSVVIIDPSNSAFSSYLNNKNIGLDDINIIITSDKTFKIYSPLSEEDYKKIKPNKKSTGPDSDQYRDCVDIAVKLAFGFNTFEFDAKNILQNKIVKFITNNPEIDKSIFFNESKIYREKQKSDLNLVQKFNDKLSIINEQLSKQKLMYKTQKDEVIKLANDHYNQQVELTEQISINSLNEFNQQFSGEDKDLY